MFVLDMEYPALKMRAKIKYDKKGKYSKNRHWQKHYKHLTLYLNWLILANVTIPFSKFCF
jgi:hypothetical protein